ncbi:MAG: sugar phosphate nucleotidyltransferase [Dehalococcoidia bacterium]|nr:sugar phosphate nucleotidyltransferase [Dehalococcoidia bacterium]
MKAVILAAGEGKRMHPLTETRPKVMLPVANKPIVEHLLVELREAGVTEVLLVVGYHSEKVRAYFGDGSHWGVSVQYATQRKQMGTADAVRDVAHWAGDRFILVNGDILLGREDIRAVAGSSTPAMALSAQDDVTGLGVVEMDGQRVVRLHEKVEKPPSNLANAGLYLLTSAIFAAIAETRPSRRGEYELPDSLKIMIDGGTPLIGHKVGRWLNFTYPWDLLGANELLLQSLSENIEGTIEPGAYIKGPIALGKGSVIRSGSYIIGPVIIGRNCDIGPNCYIRPATAIADGCHVGASVEVKNSIIMAGSKAPHHNYVGDSVIGEDCNLGAGTKTANLRLDKLGIQSMGVRTGRKKLGAIIGDGVQTGINASINIGCAIGSYSQIGPGAIVSGTLLPRSVVT